MNGGARGQALWKLDGLAGRVAENQRAQYSEREAWVQLANCSYFLTPLGHCHPVTIFFTRESGVLIEVRHTGIEPVTCGLRGRCSA